LKSSQTFQQIAEFARQVIVKIDDEIEQKPLELEHQDKSLP
jgi:hypothetical protein